MRVAATVLWGALALGAVTACGGETPVSAGAESSVADVEALETAMKAGPIVLVDVRTPDEFAAGHVEGAKNIPLSDLDARLFELESHKAGPVYVICQSGGRSARATTALVGQGFQAINVEGGTGAWKASGRPVVK